MPAQVDETAGHAMRWPTRRVPPVHRDEPPDLTRGKNIVVCADGTGNANVKGRGSNVFKLFEAVDTTSHLHDRGKPRQIAFYHEGVGTENWWPRRVLGGATGLGLAHNVRHLYREIARVYAPEDRLYLFGFSRGAFTVRTLAGLIDCCGVPQASAYATNKELTHAVAECYAHYKRTARAPSPNLDLNVKRHPRQKHPIEFLGVWDTVDAVGLPLLIVDTINKRFLPFKFDVRGLHESVRYGCHALALDEPRQSFRPVLWSRAANVEQVWFAGAHSDTGGGYPRQGLSLIAMHWMIERAAARGLQFSEGERRFYDEHQMPADKLHDPRTGMALYYRWKPRDVAGLCAESGTEPTLHISVLDRIAQGVEGYAPDNVPGKRRRDVHEGARRRAPERGRDRKDAGRDGAGAERRRHTQARLAAAGGRVLPAVRGLERRAALGGGGGRDSGPRHAVAQLA